MPTALPVHIINQRPNTPCVRKDASLQRVSIDTDRALHSYDKSVCLTVRLTVRHIGLRRNCVKTTQPTIMRFSLADSPMTPASSRLTSGRIYTGNIGIGAPNERRGAKIAIFSQ